MRAPFLLLLPALCGLALAQYPAQVYGVDVSDPVSTDDFSCLNADNLTFAIVRCWHSYGSVDTNVVPTVANAWAGGLSSVGVYMFPCPSCGDGGGQVQTAANYLASNNVKFDRFWFDIEGGTTYWSSDTDTNVAFFEDMLNEAASLGLTVGVYTSESQWGPIMGSYSGAANLPLWYAHYDGSPSFSDFEPFNGWTKPYMKQFSDAGAKCGVSYDINWHP